jgi:GNAT superfamily N-acetyltransferase
MSAFHPLRTLKLHDIAAEMNFGIRRAVAADVPAMHGLRLSVSENRLSDTRRVTLASYRPYIEAGWAWVAETQFGIAGFAVIDATSRSVWALFVAPDAEGSGIGRALHQQMLEWAQGQGIDHLSLTTEGGSRAARFYERAGWSQVGTSAESEVRFSRSV